MDDLISRKDLLKTIREAAFDTMVCIDNGKLDIPHGWFKGMTTAESIIEEFPSAQPELRWIPCSERHPDANDTVLVRCGNKYDIYVWTCHAERNQDDYFWEDDYGYYHAKWDVQEWMLIPE